MLPDTFRILRYFILNIYYLRLEMFMILGIIVLTIFVIYWLSSSPFKWKGTGVKWMVPWPFLGNTASALTMSYFDFWLNFYMSMEGHKMVGFHYFQSPCLLIRDPNLLRQIMVTEADNFNAHSYYTRESDVFKKNVFSAEGREWRGYRSKMTPFFSPSRIKAMQPIIESLVDCFVDTVGKESKNGPVETNELCLMLATDTVVSCIFGLEPECFKDRNSFFMNLQREIPGFFMGLRNLVGTMSPMLYKLLGLSAFRKETTKSIRNFVQQIIEARSKGQVVRQDLMQGMVELYNKEILNHNDTKFNTDGTQVARFDLDGITAQGMILFLAGTETTGHTLTFLLYELARHQDIQDKLRKEISDAKGNNNGTIDYEEIQKITYLNMVFEETLRLYPVAPFVPRKCTNDTTLNGVKVEKETVIAVCIVGIHRDPKIYENPEKFEPERFRPGVKREVGTFLPFGLGPRTCLGVKLSEVEIKLAVCRLLSKFKVLTSPETPTKVRYGYGFTTGPRGGMKLNFQPI